MMRDIAPARSSACAAPYPVGATWPARWLVALLGALLVLLAAPPLARAGEPLTVWHAYRGDEERGLAEAVRLAERALSVEVTVLAVPFDAYLTKLQTAVPAGHGPDVFIDAHERLTSHVRMRVVAPMPGDAKAPPLPPHLAGTLDVDGKRYGVALATKALALYVNPALLAEVPPSLEALARVQLPPGTYPLAYEAENVFFHACIVHAFGGTLLDADGLGYGGASPAALRAAAFASELTARGVVPREPSGTLVTSLFRSGRAAAVVGGPYLAAELSGVTYRVAPLPHALTKEPTPLRSYVTVEGALLTPRGAAKPGAVALATFLAGPEGSLPRARVGRQVVVDEAAWAAPDLAGDPTLAVFRSAAMSGVPMSGAPAMRAVWEPTGQALKKILRGDVAPAAALAEAKRRFDEARRPPPPPSRTGPWLLALGALLLVGSAMAARRGIHFARSGEARRALRLLPWVTPATLAIALLVVVPLAFGALTSFFAGTRHEPVFVGLANYVDIVSARGGPVFGSDSVYRTLLVTVLWTAANLALHVALGLLLGTLLARPALRLRGVYRVLLIVPWAVPSYVTALVWKGMFHRQFGAINALLELVGVAPVSWFSRFGTAFAANLATNVWLGFPFMMVVVVSALTGIDPAVLEAAEVDGATRWQRFRLVTLPLVLPAIAPAVALGGVWTFNMFNVVYLVSGGEPDGSTDILVSEAYRWAFTREAQLGYGTAYAVLIFLLLVVTSRLTSRRSEAEAPTAPLAEGSP